MADISEIDYLLTIRTSLDARTKANYINYYKRLKLILKNDINKLTEEEIITAIDNSTELDKKTKEIRDVPISIRLALLNIALIIKQVYQQSTQELTNYRIILNKQNNISNLEKNVELKTNLPTIKELNDYTNKLFEEGKYTNFIVNYLILNFNTRNMDINLIITRNSEDITNKDNYIVLHKGSAKYVRFQFKTAINYECKSNVITSSKMMTALNSLLGDNEKVFLLAKQDGERIADSSLNKFVSKFTYNELGQGVYTKAVLNERSSMKSFEKVSANRGTSLKELNKVYDVNFENEDDKMTESVSLSNCKSKIPMGETSKEKMTLKRELKRQELSKLKE